MNTPTFRHHRYEWSKPFAYVRHQWELVGPEGGIDLHVGVTDRFGDSCGLEFHHNREAWKRLYGRDEAFHHKNCPLLGAPCWHDGTSMGGQSLWEEEVRDHAKRGDHGAIFRILEREYARHFDRATA